MPASWHGRRIRRAARFKGVICTNDMLDHLIPKIENLEKDGAVVLLKWDGERESLKKTVWIGKHDSDFSFR